MRKKAKMKYETDIINISVVIPVYNFAAHIEKTVENINASTMRPFEILLVNDGSTDESLQVCRTIAGKYGNVRVIDKKNGGVADARNKGLENATGEYICFADQDDYVDPQMYEKAAQAITAYSHARYSRGAECENREGRRYAGSRPDVAMVSTGQIINGSRIPYESFADRVYINTPSTGDVAEAGSLNAGVHHENTHSSDDVAEAGNIYAGADMVQEKLLKAFLFRGYKLPERDMDISVNSTIWKSIIRRELLTENSLKFKRFINYEDDYIMTAAVLCHAQSVITLNHIGYYWRISSSSESHRANYIEDYAGKTRQLLEYMIKLLADAAVPENIIKIFKEQFIFEKTIDVIANEYSAANPAPADKKRSEAAGYIKENGLFEIDFKDAEPLDSFHRLKNLYKYAEKKDIDRLISGVNKFLKTENFIHGSKLIMKILNTRK